MGIWVGFPLTFVACLICALLGIAQVVPAWLAVILIIACVAVCWIECLRDILSDVRFSWGHWRSMRKEQDKDEVTKGRKWLVQDLAALIFSPLLALFCMVLGGVVFVYVELISIGSQKKL